MSTNLERMSEAKSVRPDSAQADALHARFEAPRAIALAIFAVAIVGICITTAIGPAARSASELVASACWYPTMVCTCVFVLGPPTRLTGVRNTTLLKLLTFAGTAVMLLLPLLPIHRRGLGKIAGAAQAGAAAASTTRLWQLARRIEEARHSPADFGGAELSWGFGRRLYMTCAWAWHDLERSRVLPGGTERAHARRLLWECVGWILFAAAALGSQLGLAPLLAASPRPVTLLGAPLAAPLATPLAALQWLVRTAAGATSVLSGFHVLDLTVRSAHALVNGVDVPSIFGKRLWHATSLEEFWREWNTPVQQLLAHGVYKPLVHGLHVPDALGKVLCFGFSGAMHAWPIAAAGSPPWALCTMCGFFLLQPPLLAVEKSLRLRGKPYLYTLIVVTSSMFVEPLAALDLEA